MFTYRQLENALKRSIKRSKGEYAGAFIYELKCTKKAQDNSLNYAKIARLPEVKAFIVEKLLY